MAFVGLAFCTSTGGRLSQGRKLEEDRCSLGIYQGDSPGTLHVQGQVKDPSNLLLSPAAAGMPRESSTSIQ